MDHMGSPPLHPADTHSFSSIKRKRSPSNELPSQPTPPAKIPKTHANHLQINYLARQFPKILPLISTEDSLPSLLSLISDYDGVLQRHESMAGNLGARPLGPMLIQRFERLFDGPPGVLKSHGKEGTSVGWLDVVEFARNKPEQFNLEKMRDGVRVCQFYTKQCRVEISEEDFLLVKSGMPQKLIPPQPIVEDEEKELGTLEILEKSLSGVVQLADQVSARARQLNHRLKNRKTAIISRREAEAAAAAEEARSPRGDSYHRSHTNGGDHSSDSPTGGFVAVNSRYPPSNDRPSAYNGSPQSLPQTPNTPITNGTLLYGASAATRAELMSKFHTKSDRPSPSRDSDHPRRLSNHTPRPSIPSKPNPKPFTDSMEYASVLMTSASPVPIPNTPSSLLPYQKPSTADRFDDSGPYKGEMMQRMEQLNRGDRVQPPCDRCRRLHMDCLKNLTACMGCTKKHAKCSWKDVEEQELKDHPFVARVKALDEGLDTGSDGDGKGSVNGNDRMRGRYGREDVVAEKMGVRDEELLGEETGDEDIEMGKEPERQHSVQSTSPPIITVIREIVREEMEPLPPPAEAKAALHVPTTQHEGAIIGFDNSAPAPYGPISQPAKALNGSRSLSPPPRKTHTPRLEHTDQIIDATAISTPQHQAPQAQMQAYSPPDTNGTNGHVQTQYKKDMYSQLNEATREYPEPMRVYTAGSEPIQTESSPTQQQMEGITVETQLIEHRSPDIQVEPSQSFQTAPMQTEQLPSPLLQSQDMQSTQMPNPPFSSQPMQT